MKNSILFCVLVLFIASCASTGNQTLKSETESSVAAKIVNNVTTQAEIKAMFDHHIKQHTLTVVLRYGNIN